MWIRRSRDRRALIALAALSLWACEDDKGGDAPQQPDADLAGGAGGGAGGAGGDLGGAGGGLGGGGGTALVERPTECDAEATTGVVGPEGLTLTVSAGALIDAEVQIPAGALPEGTEITVACGESDLVAEGYTALGPVMSIQTPTPGMLQGHAEITLVYSAPDKPERIQGRHLRLFWQPDNYPYVAEPPVMNPKADLAGGTFALRTPGLGQFQLGYDDLAGTPETFEFTYRAIGGISMGGAGSAYLGTRYGDRFDMVLPLGGPTDWRYLMWYISERLLGGFCAHDQGDGLGAWCGAPGPSDVLEHEGVSMNNWYFDDSGGSFDRTEYVSIFQDLAYAYGNPLLYNPESPYLPPGMPPEWMLLPKEVRCAPECRGDECPPAELPFSIPTGFYDDEYNPDGELPVIPFCDGEDGEPLGYFDDAPHKEPIELAYAVDLNENGRRDAYEPVIRNLSEPYEDVGCDGVASVDEPGYDPITQPDPAGDDYHWYRNPLGTESNWLWDDCGDGVTEPWQDFGLDGVADTPSFDEGGYDWGQGNGVFDYNPNMARMLDRNPAFQYKALPDPVRRRMRFWNDAGIRDIFNLGVAHSHFMGQVQSTGENVRIYDGFPTLIPGGAVAYAPQGDQPDPFGDAGTHVLVRYGKPDATQAELDAGDGKHVGSVAQALSRFITMFDWLHHRWPDGDFDPVAAPLDRDDLLVFFDSERLGKRYRYAISLPPGYYKEENADRRYPVMIIMHGYGQAPEDLPVTGLLLANNMARGFWQKSIVVFPEGFCGKSTEYQCNDGIDNDGDGRVDAGNDAALRVACEGDGDCSRDYTCRNDYCCPPEWPDCGPPDLECGTSPEHRNEAGPEPITLCADGVDNDLDGRVDTEDSGCMGDPAQDTEEDCKQGNFYTDHPVAKDGSTPGPNYEGAVLDMLDHLDENFRTRAPETHTIIR